MQSRDEWIRYNDTEVSLILLPDYNFSKKSEGKECKQIMKFVDIVFNFRKMYH